jgi:hypothetical protein
MRKELANKAIELPALRAAAHSQRSPHSYFGEATFGGGTGRVRRALLFTLKKLRGRT